MTHDETANLPGGPPPPYTDETRAGMLIGATVAFLSVTLIFVMLRIYVRAFMLKKWGADDTFVVVSFILALITGVAFSICTRYGLSYHIWTIPVEVQQTGRRVIISATLSYHITFIMIKIAFLLQFRRVFTVKKFRTFCDVMIGFITCFGIAVIVSSIITSIPTWNGDTFASERYNVAAWWLGTAAVHLVTDIIIFLMPIPFLRKLKLKKLQRAALFASFGLGFVTTAISVVRMTTLSHVFTRDVTWDVIPSLIWSEAELNCAILCICIPTLRPLLRVGICGRARRQWSQHTMSEGENSRLTRRPLKPATFSSQCEQSLPSPGPPPMDKEVVTASPTQQKDGNSFMIHTEMSPEPTGGDSDDGSEGFEPMDEEMATTPLSPPPKCYTRKSDDRITA